MSEKLLRRVIERGPAPRVSFVSKPTALVIDRQLEFAEVSFDDYLARIEQARDQPSGTAIIDREDGTVQLIGVIDADPTVSVVATSDQDALEAFAIKMLRTRLPHVIVRYPLKEAGIIKGPPPPPPPGHELLHAAVILQAMLSVRELEVVSAVPDAAVDIP